VVFCFCFYSNPLEAYTQQYQVGDTGPNGGTVTSSTITSVITNTEVALNGGFEDTTTTTQYTETVIEQISTTTTTTQQTTVLTSTTTSNSLPTINDTDWSSTGRVKLEGQTQCRTGGSSSTVGAGEACTGYMNNTNNNLVTEQNSNFLALGGGEIQSEQFEMGLDLTVAEIQSGFQLNYGVDVQSHKSNTTVPLCANTGGDCKDVFRITAKLYKAAGANATNLIGEYSNFVTLTYNGTQTHSFTQDIATNNYTEVWGQMELWGADAGYHSGYYGPVFSDPFMTLTYDAITTITETITNIVLSTQETIYNTSEDTLTSVYIGDPIQDTIVVEPIDYTEVDSFEIEIVNEETGGGIEMEFTVEVDETTNVATVEMSSTNLDTGVVQVETIAEISLDFDMDTGGTEIPEITVAEIEADIGSQIDSAIADIEVSVEAPVIEVEVNTTEGGLSENASTEPEVSETEVGTDTSTTEQTESLQESNSNVEQPVGEDNNEPASEASGDADSEGDTSGSETESEAESSGTNDTNQEDGDSPGGNDTRGEEKDDGKSEGKSKDKTKTKSNERKAEKVKLEIAKAKQKIANRILSAMADTYSAINETTKIAVMQSLADTENFKKYVQKQNEDAMEWYSDTQVYRDQIMMGDPYGALFGSAQDNLMNEMINEQYKPGYGLGLQ
jgi:hypothetical protein|tara:strand:+ start:2764 stop:4776 length:2013 start_codon:yes stop_codon:yes gene_type:complete